MRLPSFALAASLVAPFVAADFDPYYYNSTFKQFVHCPAKDRSGPIERDISLRLGYLDINSGAGKTLVLAHGWPSLWTTWREQIEAFKNDYRLIVPEWRGYGDSEHPKDLNASNTFYDFVGDVTCILDNAKIDKTVIVGNDFGSQVAYEAGRARPDRFIAVFTTGVPYLPSKGAFIPNAGLAALNKNFTYQVYLGSTPKAAADELDPQVRNGIRSSARVVTDVLPAGFLAQNNTFLGPWKDIITKNNGSIPASPIMSQMVEDFMVASYNKQGWYGTFNGYQYGNRYLTYQYEVEQGNITIPQPTFTLFPTGDPVADWQAVATELKSSSYLLDHQNATIHTAHWPNEEQPAQFNAILQRWLKDKAFSKY